ncbi:cupin domain-containing protein [Nocardia sp. NPDC050697]|uniref:cupin domain-containing protein n=1 Tax=Nocardia sp. NPDC050697 TaxID=3155158 RepID=UPI003409F9F2
MIVRDVLLEQPIPGRAVHRVEIRRITLDPGDTAPHRHNTPVFGSVERGTILFQVSGGPEVLLGPGDTFYEPADVLIDHFDATGGPATFLGYFLLDADQEVELAFP